MAFLSSLLAFIVVIAILITFHEYGHFLAARLFNVNVLQFSLGFGPVLWRHTSKRGTEYRLSAILIGGYVKLLDERHGMPLTTTEQMHTFNRQAVWKRSIILLAGPFFNLLLAFIAYWCIFVIGYPELTPQIGTVAPHSIAANAGLQSGEKITQIGDHPTHSWSDVEMALMSQMGSTTPIVINSVNTAQQSQTHSLNVADWKLEGTQTNVLKSLGIEPYLPIIPPLVNQVVKASPADQVGILADDKILTINKVTISNWQNAIALIQSQPHQTIEITLERQKKILTKRIILGANKQNGKEVGYLGVISPPIAWPPGMIHQVRYAPWLALQPALIKTYDNIVLNIKILSKLITGQISWHGLSGPVGIAQTAAISASLGITTFLAFLALISISLGILNLMPIPILDGGQLVLCWIEALLGHPLSERVQIIGIKIGIIFVLGVMTLALYNDIIRLQ